MRIQNVTTEQKHELPIELDGCIFIGHIATDCDSISSAIACAELFNGVAVRASNNNTEIDYMLDYWKYDKLIPDMADYIYQDNNLQWHVRDNRKICLVDHNQITQFNDALKLVQSEIVGCIDHHALQNNCFVTDLPVFVNIRPWGSASTIVAHMYITHDRMINKQTAGLLLSAILSDTLNLHSPTTTRMDKFIVSLLAQCTNTTNVDHLAHEQFQAKSRELQSVSTHALIRGDLKQFKLSSADNKSTVHVAFGVIETVDTKAVLQRKSDIIHEIKALKHELHVDVAFIAVVDIVKLKSYCFFVEHAEQSLGKLAYGVECGSDCVAALGNRVSRKKQFIPPLSSVVSQGWSSDTSSVSDIKINTNTTTRTQKQRKQLSDKQITQQFGQVIHECTSNGCRTVRLKPQLLQDTSLVHNSDLFVNESTKHGKTAKAAVASSL